VSSGPQQLLRGALYRHTVNSHVVAIVP